MFKVDYCSYCYPFESDRTVDFSKLFPNIDVENMTETEIDDWICSLIKQHPYIDGCMRIEFTIRRFNGLGWAVYHSLTFRNTKYDKQKRTDLTVKYRGVE